MFWCGVAALVVEFFLPYTAFQAMGIDPGLVKLHPATVMVIISGLFALVTGVVPFHQRSRQAPGLIVFLIGIPILFVYSIYFTGFSGSATFPETFFAAGMMAVLLETATPKQKRLLGVILLSICVLQVAISLQESLVQQDWFPIIADPDVPIPDFQDDFRAHAFYDHPLTASLITTMAMFLLYSMRLNFLLAAPVFCFLLVGLFAFGGRTALAVALAVSATMALSKIGAGVIRRNLKIEHVVVTAVAVVAVPLLITFIVTQTSIGDRIMDTLYSMAVPRFARHNSRSSSI